MHEYELVNALAQEYRLIHLLYHRNKNQHKMAVWWKRLNMMKRNVSSVLSILEKSTKSKIEYIKLYKLVKALSKRMVKKIYYDFNGIINLNQFLTLGVVLIGNLGKIYSIYLQILEFYKEEFRKYVKIREIRDVEIVQEVNEEIGEEIQFEISAIQQLKNETLEQPFIEEAREKKKKKKSKGKKKSKSAIDDIFG